MSEAAVGAGIKAAIDAGIVKREELFITTKVWFHSYEEADCRKSIDESLKKLGLEYIDMVLLHWPFGNVYAPLGQGQANEMFDETEVRNLAEKYGKTSAQILLRFLIQSDVAVIPKSVHEERIKENIDIFDFALTEEEMERLRALDTAKPMIGNSEAPDKVEFAMTW